MSSTQSTLEPIADNPTPIVAIHKNQFGYEVVNRDSGMWLDKNNAKFWVAKDGGGVVDSILLQDDNDLKSIIDRGNIQASPEETMMGAAGSMCIYMEKGDKDFYVLPDPLGGSLLYKYQDSDLVAFSSDLRQMVDWLSSTGRRINKSYLYFSMILSVGNGLFGNSSYENIEVLPAHSYLRISGGRIHVCEYPVEEYLLNCDEAYDELLQRSESEIANNIRAVANKEMSLRVSHLTGGFDSRLVLSSILSEKLQESFSFMCSGPSQTKDKAIAHGLAVNYGLTMTKDFGLQDRYVPSDEAEKSYWGTVYSAGMRPHFFTHDGHEKIGGAAIVSGGYGECFRSFYSHKIGSGESIEFAARKVWGLEKVKNENIVNPEVLECIVAGTINYLKGKLEKGWELHQALDLMYLNERNRYHIGNSAMLVSRKTLRVDPLYSLSGIKAALHVGPEKRAANMVGLDLMHKMQPGLMNFKFGDKKFPGIARKKYPALNSIDLPLGKPNYRGRVTKKIMSSSKKGASDADLIKANKLNASLWQVVKLEESKKELSALMRSDKFDIESAKKFLNLKYINDLVSRELNNRVKIRQVHQCKEILKFCFHE